MKQSFSVLHISDLHERGRRESEPARRERVLGDAWLRNLAEIRDEGVDLVCMTGDLAQSGKPDEYQRAGDFLVRTLAELDLGRDRLFLVPGNHDINRSRRVTDWQAVRDKVPRADRLEVARWIAGGKAPLGMEPAWLSGTFKRQAAFRAWLKRFGLGSQLPAASPHRKLGYRAKVRLPDLAFDVWVIGLDSAWLSGADDDAGNLRLTDAQLDKLCTDERGKPLAGFRLALMHHPLTDLYDGAQCRRLLGDTTDLLLHGHVHEVGPALWADPDRRLAQFAAGCLFEGTRADHHANGCTLIRVTCDASGRLQRYELRFRSYSSRGGHWHDDSSLYRAAKNGRLTIDVPDPSGSPQTSRPSLPESLSASTAEDGQQNVGAAGQGTPGPSIAELELEQRYRDSVVDSHSRASSLGFLRWQHANKPPRNLSRLKLFVPHQQGLAKRDVRPHLRRLAEHAQDEHIRVQAAGLLDSEGAAHLYSLVVHTDNPAVRSEAIWALAGRCSDPVVQRWLQDVAKTSQSAMVRIRAALALCSLSDVALREAGHAALVAIVDDDNTDESVRLEAAEELVQRPVLEQLAAHATSEEIRLRAQDSIAVLDLRDQILSLPISASQPASGLDTLHLGS